MELYFLEVELHKFQICCWEDCGKDAVTQYKAHTRTQVFVLSSCAEHPNYIEDFRNMLEEGLTPIYLKRKHGLNLEELYIVHVEDPNKKCKYLQWREHKYPKKPKPKVDVSETEEEVTPDWKWVSNIDKWMNIRGQVVPISKLSSKELVCSAILVRRVNFSRITKRVRWVSLLTPPLQFDSYPNAALQVGYEAAGEKLEEFKEEAQARGLLT